MDHRIFWACVCCCAPAIFAPDIRWQLGFAVLTVVLALAGIIAWRRNPYGIDELQIEMALPHGGTSDGFADLLPYRYPIRPDVVKLTGGRFQAAWEFGADDVSTLEEASIVNTAYQVALTIGGLMPGTAVQFYTCRTPITEYDRGRGDRSPVLRVLDELREEFFTKREPVFVSRRFVVLTWHSPEAGAVKGRARASLEIGGEVKSEDARLADFEALCATFESGLAALRVRRLGEDSRGRSELLGFLLSRITGYDGGSLVLPPPSVPLNAYFSQEFRGGFDPRIGEMEVGCVELSTYPTETWPVILDRLASLGVSNTLCVRFMPMPIDEARKQHRGSWAASVGASTFRSGFVDPHEAKQARQSAEAYGAAADEYTRNGRTTIVLVLMAPERDLVKRGQLAVLEALKPSGFEGKVMRLAAFDTWLSTLPGNMTNGRRKHPLSALDIAHIVPLHETERGRRYAESEALPPQTPAVTYAVAPGGTLSRIHLNGLRDLGHGLLSGVPGSGKSVTLAFFAAMVRARLPNFGVSMLDKGRSARPLALMLDGTFYDLLAPGSAGFAFFANVEEPESARVALKNLCEMLELWGVTVSADRSKSLESAIRVIARIPAERRSMLAYVEQLQDPEGVLRPVIGQYTRLGPLGSALDASTDSFEAGRFNVVEMERALALEPRYLIPLLRVVMQKLVSQARRLQAAEPDLHWLYTIDEVPTIARHPIGERFILDTFEMGRKENAWCWLASPSANAYTSMANFARLLEACATRIYFGDPAATDAVSKVTYGKMQLPERGIELLPHLEDRAFILHAPGANVLQHLNLRLDRDALAIIGTSRMNGRVDEYLARFPVASFGKDRWKVELWRSLGAHAAADRLEAILKAGSDELLVASR